VAALVTGRTRCGEFVDQQDECTPIVLFLTWPGTEDNEENEGFQLGQNRFFVSFVIFCLESVS
jgi:hypothetical protein